VPLLPLDDVQLQTSPALRLLLPRALQALSCVPQSSLLLLLHALQERPIRHKGVHGACKLLQQLGLILRHEPTVCSGQPPGVLMMGGMAVGEPVLGRKHR